MFIFGNSKCYHAFRVENSKGSHAFRVENSKGFHVFRVENSKGSMRLGLEDHKYARKIMFKSSINYYFYYIIYSQSYIEILISKLLCILIKIIILSSIIHRIT